MGPNATAIAIIGEFSDWQPRDDLSLERINDNGVWEIRLPAEKTIGRT